MFFFEVTKIGNTNINKIDFPVLYFSSKEFTPARVEILSWRASHAPTRKNWAPTWVSRQDQTANETPNPTKAYLMAQFGPNLAPFIL